MLSVKLTSIMCVWNNTAVKLVCMHSSGVRCLESSGADWLPSDVTLGLCSRRSGLWSVCQQRKAGGNRPQGQSKGCAVRILLFFRHIVIFVTHDRSNPKPSSDIFNPLSKFYPALSRTVISFEIVLILFSFWAHNKRKSLLLLSNILLCSFSVQLYF